MADGTGEITIERSLEQIQQGIRDIGTASKSIDKDLRSVQSGLRFDPSNTELLAQKQELLSQKLENSKARSQELTAAIAELNRINAENGQLTDGQAKLLSTYQQQLKETQNQVTGLTGATQKSAESTKTFSQSMTEFQSNLRAAQQVMRGVSSAYELLDTRTDSNKKKQQELQYSLTDLGFAYQEGKISQEEYKAKQLELQKELEATKRAQDKLSNEGFGNFLKQGQQAVQMMSGIASMGKLLGKSNSTLATSFSTVAMGVGAAFVAFKLADDLLGKFEGTSRTVAGAVAILAGAVTAGAVAWMAYHGTMSLGVAVPIILAALAVGAAGIKALTKKTNAETAAISSEVSTTSMPSIATSSTPSVPTYSGGVSGGTTTYISQGGLTEGQMEMASYRGFMRAITESGLNDPKFIGALNINGRQLAETIFNDFLDVNDRRTRGFALK